MGALLDPLRCDAWRSMLIGCFRPEAVIRHVSEKNRFWVLCPEINSSEDKGNPKLDWWLNITNNFYALQPYEGAGVDFTEENIAAGRLSLLIKPDDIAGIGDTETNFLRLIREWKTGFT